MIFTVFGCESIVIIARRLVRAFAAVEYPSYFALYPSEGGDIICKVSALQLPADKANGDNDSLPEFLVFQLGEPYCFDKTGEAGDGILPRSCQDLPDDLRHLHWVVGRTGPGAQVLRSIKDTEGEEPLRLACGSNAYDMVNDAFTEQCF